MADDSTPEVEQLVEEIRARGNYRTREDVLASGLTLLRSREQRRAIFSIANIRANATRQKWAIVIWAGQVLATVGAVLAAAVEIESILFTLPALTVCGFALALVARPLNSWLALSYSISGPLVAACCAALILGFRWGPNEAAGKIVPILVVYAVCAAPLAWIVLVTLFNWTASTDHGSFFPRQYSLKSLLALTTALCLIVPAARLLFVHARRGDFLVFFSFTLVTLCLVGVAVYVFLADRRRQWLEPRDDSQPS